MKLLQVVTDPDRRGAQVFAHDLETALRTRGHDVTTVALGPGRNDGSRLELEVIGHGVRDLRTLQHLRERMRAAEMTIAHGASTGPACAIAGAGPGRPFVYRQISDSRFWAPTRTKRLRVRATLSPARRVIALSEFNRRELVTWIGVPSSRIRVVPNGVPTARFTIADASTKADARRALGLGAHPTIAFVGALVPEKGAATAIAHLGSLPEDVHLVVAGDGPERARLESAAARDAPGRVHFLGSVDDVVPVYHAADVVTFPAYGGDAMPATLIEAGLCGVPVAASTIGAIPETVIDGDTGFVVDPDRTDAYTAALRGLLTDASQRERFGRAARTHCLASYAIEPVAAAYEAVLRDALGS